MVEQSIVFDFTRVEDFMDDYNIEFFVADMDGVNKNYEFVIADDSPDNIDECLDSDGAIDTSEVHTLNIGDDGEVSLLYSKGVNGSRVISLGSSDVVMDVGDENVSMKAMFLRSLSTGYVLAYCILARPVPITESVIFPASGLVWTIRNEG